MRNEATALGVAFGDASAQGAMRSLVASTQTDATQRRDALKALLAAKDPKLVATLQALLADPALRDAALSGLAMYDDPQTPAKILVTYSTLPANEKRSALATLASRSPYGLELLKAVSDKQIPTTDLSADLIRQLHNLHNDKIDEMLGNTWGQVRSTAADKTALINKYRELLAKKTEQAADPNLGRTVFGKTCQQCHTLFDAGEHVGPDLTGSNRGDLEYILQNMVDPNAVIPNDYRASTLETKDDRVITGIVKAQDENSVTIITANETVTVPRNEIASLRQNELSMMPEGLLEPLSEQEVRDLIYYLRQPGQVPMAQ